MALIDAANDKQKEVRQMIVASLHEIGKKQPELVLSTIKAYLIIHQKVKSSVECTAEHNYFVRAQWEFAIQYSTGVAKLLNF